MFRPMKQETMRRRAADFAKARAEQKAWLIARLEAKVEEQGHDSIYAEMLVQAYDR